MLTEDLTGRVAVSAGSPTHRRGIDGRRRPRKRLLGKAGFSLADQRIVADKRPSIASLEKRANCHGSRFGLTKRIIEAISDNDECLRSTLLRDRMSGPGGRFMIALLLSR
jgi:hypothetical protein